MKHINQIEHITKATIQKHSLSSEQALKLFNKFYMGSSQLKCDSAGLNFLQAVYSGGQQSECN